MDIIVIGAGLSGLSAAITLARGGRRCKLVSVQRSERAQSVLAEGGFNAAANTMGEGDSTADHFADTMRGGVYLADPNAAAGLVENAPKLLEWLIGLGVPFNMSGGRPVLRNFGGQKKKRTAYAKSSTGKMIMSALIDEARKYEAAGLIERLPHHGFMRLITDGSGCLGAVIRDTYTGEMSRLYGRVILCCGGMNGMFPGMTTGTTANSGDVQAVLFSQGVGFANLEMLQYHPTTIGIAGKRCLVTEAARGEGGRLYIMRGGEKWYFMEEKYPELKNLMPRDVVAREMYLVRRREDCSGEVYLDMTGLPEETWRNKLPDLRQELIEQLSLDPAAEPVPVREGIHYFMGGIYVDERHRTSLEGLYAAGECACQYHGANRLGGNSKLGAVYGGRVAAEDILSSEDTLKATPEADDAEPKYQTASALFNERLSEVLLGALGIVRSEDKLKAALKQLDGLEAA
ncbi:MAG: FAD-binding protein, partial [Ruminococcus sp.]|nr:FAD-binding protein [Ruminococcus sp.]